MCSDNGLPATNLVRLNQPRELSRLRSLAAAVLSYRTNIIREPNVLLTLAF
jgi:hypothetical protein